MEKGKKKQTLADIIAEEAAGLTAKEPQKGAAKKEVRISISDIRKAISEVDKSDYLKMSATLPGVLFLLMDEDSRKRRLAKQEYTYSAIIREALLEYYEKRANDAATA